MKSMYAGLLLAALGAGGCASFAYGSAPTPDPNYQYVVGRKANPGAIWVCPTANTGEQCRQITVVRQ
ncbi:MAG: hypothetical protein AAF411_16795 [Myxococcota bacterium]